MSHGPQTEPRLVWTVCHSTHGRVNNSVSGPRNFQNSTVVEVITKCNPLLIATLGINVELGKALFGFNVIPHIGYLERNLNPSKDVLRHDVPKLGYQIGL